MPRVVPSDVVRVADQMFPDAARRPGEYPNVAGDAVPALAKLVESIPDELLARVETQRYAELMFTVAALKEMGAAFQARGSPTALPLAVRGLHQNPVALIRAVLATCPDEAPSAETASLPFVTNAELRESIRLDISVANQDLAQAEWKGATVLAGSAVEALLLWALHEYERNHPKAVSSAVKELLREKTIGSNPGPELEGPAWHLHEYVEVAAKLHIIKVTTATLVRLTKDFRNLIHPGRSLRLGQRCDRATALGALAAVEAVARDLSEDLTAS